MSYVIQNFYDSSKKINLTPRFKLLFLLNNLHKIFFFIKLNTFFNFIFKLNILNLNYFFIFFKYFYSKQYLKLLNKNILLSSNNYINNLSKSSIYLIFYYILNFLKNKKINLDFFQLNNNFFYVYQQYYFSFKLINIKINKSFYKNIFFFFLFANQVIWYQHSKNLNFYLNFLLINYNLKIFRFYNGHFLKVYNY